MIQSLVNLYIKIAHGNRVKLANPNSRFIKEKEENKMGEIKAE